MENSLTYAGTITSSKELTPAQNQNQNQDTTLNNYYNLQALISTAGTLDLNDEQMAILKESVDPDEVLIRPDGLVYLSWSRYHKQLTRMFGTRWTLIPNGMPQINPNGKEVIWGFTLIVGTKDKDGNIKQHYVGFAIGGNEYHPNNPRMNYNDAVEGAKSNALMRLCKELGMFLELWDKEWVENWRKKYAVRFKNAKGEYEWRKKTKAELEAEGKVKEVEAVEVEEVKSEVVNHQKHITESEKQKIREMAQHPAINEQERLALLKILNQKITVDKANKIKARIEEKIQEHIKKEVNTLLDYLKREDTKDIIIRELGIFPFAEDKEIIEEIKSLSSERMDEILEEVKIATGGKV